MGAMEIGMCSWPIASFTGELGLHVVQIGFFATKTLEEADARAIAQAAGAANVTIAGSFVAFEGEDYTSIERIAATGGYMPDDVYQVRLRTTRNAAVLTAELGCQSLAVHAATIPHDSTSSIYNKLLERVGDVANAVARYGVRLLLETGRELVDTLIDFVEALGQRSVGVNFDPGNLVVYGTDEPDQCVSKLGDRIHIVHLKDAMRSARPGLEYGRAARLGSGDAQTARVMSELRRTGYAGPLLLEVPAGGGDLQDVRDAINYLRQVIARDTDGVTTSQ